MTTPNLGLDLVAGADTIATALVTKFNGNMADLDAAVAGKVGAGTPVNNLTVLTGSAGSTPLVVKGILGQSAPLLDLRDNADVTKFAVDATGAITVGGDTAKVSKAGGDTITASGAAVVPLTVKGASGQSVNLLEARNDAGTLLVYATAAGQVLATEFDTDAAQFRSPGSANILGYSNRLTTHAVGQPILVLDAKAGQTANFTEWRNSGGTVLTHVKSSGAVEIAATTAGVHALLVRGQTPLDAVMAVRGAASQSANLAEFQNSGGTVLALVRSDGQVSAFELGSGTQSVNAGGIGAKVWSTTSATNQTPLIVKGAAGQTANLFEAQNSAGTVLASVSAAGQLGQTDGGTFRTFVLGDPNSAGAGFRTVRVVN